MERESIHGNDVSSRAGRPACGIVSFAEGTAEVLLRSRPRSSTPSVHEFIQKPEKPATLVAPRLAAGSGRALKQNKSVVRWSGECHGCLTAGFFQDAAQPSGSFA